MKLMHGYDYERIVGEIYLRKEIVDALLSGHTFALGASVRTTAHGTRELACISIIPVPAQPKLDVPINPVTKTCMFCKKEVTGKWWKCCPEHTPERGEKITCTDCARVNHPSYFGAE